MVFLVYGSCVMWSDRVCFARPPPISFQMRHEDILANVASQPLVLYIVPSVAWGEDGIDELHVVGYVHRELTLHTYMQRVCLHYKVCVCCIRTYNILNRIFIQQGVL